MAPSSHTVMNYQNYLDQLVKCAQAYGVVVGTGNLPSPIRPTPVRGAFRPGEIILPVSDPEEALFILLHGLGHIAQWTLYPDRQAISYANQEKIGTWTDLELKDLLDHELESLPFSLGFLEQNSVPELSDWYRQYFFADQTYIANIFKQNRYLPSLFGRFLGRARHSMPRKIARIRSRPFPSELTSQGNEGFIHVI